MTLPAQGNTPPVNIEAERCLPHPPVINPAAGKNTLLKVITDAGATTRSFFRWLLASFALVHVAEINCLLQTLKFTAEA